MKSGRDVKNAPISLLHRATNVRVLGPEFIPNHIIKKKFLQAKKDLIFG